MEITRREFVRSTACAAVVLSLGGVLSGCAQGSSSGPAKGDTSEVIVSMTPSSEPPAGFDPFVSWGCGEHCHEPLIQSTLITTDTDLNFKNDLATSYECSADGLTWTFTIRDDVKFTNGTPLRASDVAFTINGIVNSESSEADLSMVDAAEAPDDTTVLIHLNKPFNALLYTLAVVGIVPADAHDENYGSNPIGSGRYMLEQWDKGQQVILTANPDYYGEEPKMKRVVVVFMEEDASLAAASAGEVDIAYTSATLADGVPKGYTLLNCSSVDSRGISFSTQPSGSDPVVDAGVTYEVGNDVTCDVAVRRAINYGIDREQLINNVLNGYGQVAYSVSDGMPWASEDMKCETDIEKAKSILEDAGWIPGSDGIRVKDGTRASIPLWYMAGDSVRQGIAEEFTNQMADLGIEVNVKGASFDDIYPHQYADPVVWGWGSNAPTEIYNLNYSTGWGNFAQYKSEKIDGYLDQALACPKVEDSFPYWQRAQWDGSEGVAPQGAATWVWFANVDHLYFKRDGLSVADQKPHPHGHGWSLVNNVDAWSWLQ